MASKGRLPSYILQGGHCEGLGEGLGLVQVDMFIAAVVDAMDVDLKHSLMVGREGTQIDGR